MKFYFALVFVLIAAVSATVSENSNEGYFKRVLKSLYSNRHHNNPSTDDKYRRSSIVKFNSTSQVGFYNCPMSNLQQLIQRAAQQYPSNFDAQIQKIRVDAGNVQSGFWNVIIFQGGNLPAGMFWHLESTEYKYCQMVYNGLQYVVWLSKCY